MHLHEFGDVPYADLPTFGGSSKKLWAAPRAKARYSVSSVCRRKLCRTRCQRDWQGHILGVLAFHKRAVGGMSLMFRPLQSKKKVYWRANQKLEDCLSLRMHLKSLHLINSFTFSFVWMGQIGVANTSTGMKHRTCSLLNKYSTTQLYFHPSPELTFRRSFNLIQSSTACTHSRF